MNTVVEPSWAAVEFQYANLGDLRRQNRLICLAEQRAAYPNASIPQACGDAAATKAAYRFYNNDDIPEGEILASHQQATKHRLAQEEIVLAVQDTTVIDYTHHPHKTGLGILSDEKHHGLFLHTTLAVTPGRVPLGIIDQQAWTRSADELGKSHHRRQRPIEEKESHRWLDSLAVTGEIQDQLSDTHLINIGDREADIYDLFAKAVSEETSLLVRAAWNRRIDHPQGHLWPYLESQAIAATVTITVPRKAQQPARQADLTLRYAPVTLLPPKHRRGEELSPLSVWGVFAHEENAPADVEPVSWLLLTTVEVATCEAALERLQWYTCRWEVEVYHKVLKSGCRIEKRQLSDIAAIKRYLALDSIVGWRVLFLTMLGRQLPDMPCTAILEAHEWQALYGFIHKTDTPPSQPPTLKEATHWIGQLGGFLGRTGDRNPGVTTVWRGLQRLSDLAAVFVLFHPLGALTP